MIFVLLYNKDKPLRRLTNKKIIALVRFILIEDFLIFPFEVKSQGKKL